MLRILALYSSGFLVKEVAEKEGVSVARAGQLRHQAYKRIREKLRLPAAMVSALLFPRQHGTKGTIRNGDYSGPGVTLERVQGLFDWADAAYEVHTAQEEWEEVGLADLRNALLYGPTPPFDPTVGYRWSTKWEIWRMDAWGIWSDDRGTEIARGGPDRLENVVGRSVFFTGEMDPDDLRDQVIVGFPVIFSGCVIGSGTSASDAWDVMTDFCLDHLPDSDGDDCLDFDISEGDIKFTVGTDIFIENRQWAELVVRTGAWVAGDKWLRLLSDIRTEINALPHEIGDLSFLKRTSLRSGEICARHEVSCPTSSCV